MAAKQGCCAALTGASLYIWLNLNVTDKLPAESTSGEATGFLTHSEILQQPELWPTSLQRVRNALHSLPHFTPGKTIVTGAGTSAYAAGAIASSLRGAAAIPTTELLLASCDDIERIAPEFGSGGTLISVARSGNSPESVGVVNLLGKFYPAIRHLAITCNADGRLAHLPEVQALILDPRTNDKSLAMTSSFSNLTLAGMALSHLEQLANSINVISRHATTLLPALQESAAQLASTPVSRVVILASGPLIALGSEAALKILEMTAGQTVAYAESFLGLRHGPMSFLRKDSVILCVASSDPTKRRYEADLLGELRKKNLGRIVAIADRDFAPEAIDYYVPPVASHLPDYLRTPFEIPFAQLLAYYLSLQAGLNPDNPSPHGVITRVVQKFRIYEEAQGV